MIPRIVALALALASCGIAAAAPNDYVLLHGSVADKGTTLVVLKADSGKSYYVTAGTSDQATISGLKAGDGLAVRGVEGAYPNEIRAEAIDLDSARRTAWHPPSPAESAGTLSYKDWRLPDANRYEVYNPSAGTYTPVEITGLLGRLDAGDLVYDRTGGQWVQHPSVGGRNKAYLEGGAAAAGGMLVHGDWRLPRANRYETYDGASSRYVGVDTASVPGRLDRGEPIYDRTAKQWVQHPSLRGVSPYRSARVQGRVQSIEGPTLTIKGDDGKITVVGAAQLKPEAVRGLRWGQPVEVSGQFDAARTRFTASGIEVGK